MTPKIPVQITAGLKEIRIKDLILNEPQYPSGGMKERRARCFALCGGSKACPDLFEGSFLEVIQCFLLFFLGLHGLSARALRHLDTFSSRKKYQIIFATGKNKFSSNN